MSMPKVRIHNITTNEIIDREMNEEEFAQWQIDKAEVEDRAQAKAEAAAAKAALLAKLGITEEEAKLLLS